MTFLIGRRGFLAALAAAALPLRGEASERRIVSLGGAVTETLYRLEQDGAIVGVDSTSQFPPRALATKPDVGYVRALGAEGLISLKPNLILATAGAGPPNVLALVAEAGIPIVRVPEEATAEGVLQRVSVIATAVGAESAGAELDREIRTGFADLTARRARIGRTKRALFVLSVQNGRPLVGGSGTTADGILGLAGAANAAGSIAGWRPLSDEGLIAAAPDVIVTMSRGAGGHAPDVLSLPAISATPAGRAKAVVSMDGLYLLGFGPRTAQAASDLMSAVYPESETP
jgi:iron complex transport system substrate-binding protein